MNGMYFLDTKFPVYTSDGWSWSHLYLFTFLYKLIGSNDTKTIFDPKNEWFMNLEEYDRSSKCFCAKMILRMIRTIVTIAKARTMSRRRMAFYLALTYGLERSI